MGMDGPEWVHREPTVFMPEYAKKSIYCMTILAKMIIKGLLKALVGHSFLNSAALK